MGRTALYEEGLAKGRYVRLPTSIDALVRDIARAEERELCGILRRLVKAGLRSEGHDIDEKPAPKKRAVG